jgi:hypothetical protein
VVCIDIYIWWCARIVKRIWILVVIMSLSIQNATGCSSNLLSELSKYFGHPQFKSDLQRRATEAVLRSTNTFNISLKNYLNTNEIWKKEVHQELKACNFTAWKNWVKIFGIVWKVSSLPASFFPPLLLWEPPVFNWGLFSVRTSTFISFYCILIVLKSVL